QALNFRRRSVRVGKRKRMACDVDTGAVFKHPVHCFGCEQAFYFTLRKIAAAKKLTCPVCGSDINLSDEAYEFFVTSLKATIALIDQSSRDLHRVVRQQNGGGMVETRQGRMAPVEVHRPVEGSQIATV